jgi:hypothetical protein
LANSLQRYDKNYIITNYFVKYEGVMGVGMGEVSKFLLGETRLCQGQAIRYNLFLPKKWQKKDFHYYPFRKKNLKTD